MLNYLRGVNIKLRTNNKINLKLIPTPFGCGVEALDLNHFFVIIQFVNTRCTGCIKI